MGLETVTNIDDLVVTNPLSTDARSQGDDHIRNIKLALKTDLPNITGVMTATQAELNVNTGVTGGTVTASKTVVVDASSKIDVWNVDNLVLNGNTISAGTGAVNITPAAGSAIVLDGTINVDAGVVTGATSVTSTTFVGALTGNADTATSATSATTAGTVTTATQASITTAANLVTVGALDSGSITSNFGAIDNGASAITTTGTITGGVVVADNININGNTIISTDTAGDINLTPDTTGDLVLDGLKWPQADGSANQILVTDGAAQTSWATPATTTALTTHGDILFRNASALARLGAGTSGQFLTSGGAGADVSWSTQAAADLSPVQTNIALLGFLRSTDHATSVLNMQNGFIDQFEDQTGVDDPNSTNELYDATDDFYGPNGVGVQTSTMTGNSAPSGTASASEVLSPSGGEPWQAFDPPGDANNGWATNTATTGWIQYAFDNGLSAVALTEYRITSATGQPARAPNSWTFEGSNTGSFSGEETVLDTQSSITWTGGDTKAYTFANTTSYVYYRLDITAINGGSLIQITDLGLYGVAQDMTLISEPQVALTAPDSAHVSLFNQEVDTLTINTDIFAWVSRSKQTVTTAYVTDDKFAATTHGLLDDDRVMFISTAGDLPAGITSDIVYYVYNKTASTFEVSLTASGDTPATVEMTDDGTGTHSVLAVTQCTLVDQGDFDTGKATLSGTVDISGQPSDTDMTLIVQTKNGKETKLHGQALQYS